MGAEARCTDGKLYLPPSRYGLLVKIGTPNHNDWSEEASIVNERQSSDVAPRARFISLALGLLVMALLLLTPLKAWLNQIPYLWRIVYPLLSLFAGYLVNRSLREKEGLLATAKWAVFFASALCATANTWGAGRIFFTVARWSAILFIVAEVLLTVFAGSAGMDDAPAA